MKSEFQAKFLQQMVQKKKQDEGFTLIELLVVIIIIGILAAIALPSFLNQANKAKESESKTYVGTMNRTQQAFLLENNTFTTEIEKLGIGIPTSTKNYTYTVAVADRTSAASVSYPFNTELLRTHTGGVQVFTQTNTSESTSLAILCQSNKPKAGDPSGVTFSKTSAPTCSADYETLAK